MTEKLRKKNEEIIVKNTEIVSNKIKEFLSAIPDELGYMKSQAAQMLAFEAAIWGSYNTYEGIGILEDAKLSYRHTSEEIFKQEEAEQSNSD